MDRRAYILQSLVIGIGILILGRLAYMQLIDKSYRTRAVSATIEKYVIEPSRGLIYDRNDKLLVFNQPSYDLHLTYNLIDPTADPQALCDILGISKSEYEARVNKDWNDVKYSKNVPFLFYEKIDEVANAQLQELLHAYPGFSTKVNSVRGYSHPNASHALGYLNEIDQERLDQAAVNYSSGDVLGVAGLESTYERQLRGSKGATYQLKDNFGRNVGEYNEGFGSAPAESGSDLTTTLDIDLQVYAEEIMQGKLGAFVALEPSTGEVLAIGSSPSYDPNSLSTNADRTSSFNKLQTDSLKPFFNRATMAKYSPGSLFKPMLSLIALQEGVIRSDRYITCKGAYYYKIYRWGCHADPGTRNVTGAIQESCNTYFFTVYRELVDKFGFDNPQQGLQLITDHLYDFGLGNTLNIDLPSEHKGLVPTPDFYDDMYDGKGDWRSTYIISNGIGQGEMEMTVLQMANMAAILGNRGYYISPHLVKRFQATEFSVDQSFRTRKQVSIEKRHFEPVIEGLERAVYSGTAGLAAVPDLRICGKTGTSQNTHGKDHSVFLAFAPRDNPQIALAVIVENAGWGSSYAAPIGGLMIEKYLNGEISPSRLWVEDLMVQSKLIADVQNVPE